jgi:hypothetical protein
MEARLTVVEANPVRVVESAYTLEAARKLLGVIESIWECLDAALQGVFAARVKCQRPHPMPFVQ